MKHKLYLGLLIAGLFGSGLLLMSNMKLVRSNRLLQDANAPKLTLDESTYDFGKMKEGAIVDHVFRFTNTGRDTLRISNVKASCGCTAVLVTADRIPPGGQGELKATFNSRGKQGKIHKTLTIYSNAEPPMTTIGLLADVDPEKPLNSMSALHPQVEGNMQGSYFVGKCVNCHVEPGVGKTGAALFAASCEMCHGVEGRGAVAFAMNTRDYLDRVTDLHLSDRIQKGSPSNHMMLGFAKEHGGPLDAKQIASLVDYIRGWEKQPQ